ncbi:hypothetical protein HX871_15145 [Pseudomonas reactans]|uniref:ABC transmembrane type-1 domain-containing protein n=1 Tax=Pseudomonas reactans TaxID=117680 RepID=A0ABX2QY47_9PSED|nr:hypothetical protein [Pseudomonas reactans]NWA42614.1 hypothetical protein [Pseudomonas reactans]NWC85486.1 hypothetical protein [Pseudomonas reactans]NWD29509.1 hypothetical protein [Pseudomonas reactans]NWD95766.1 hypothetical protein [Pseudomonas reactans]
MIFESFIEDSLKPVHGLITKERLAIFALSLMLCTPDSFEILELLAKGPSISELTEKFGNSLKNLPAIPFAFFMTVVFFLSAKMHQLIAKITNKLTLKKLGTITTKLQELEKSEDDFFTNRLLEISFDWKQEKDNADKNVKRLSTLSETFISLSIICFYLTAKHDGSIIAAFLLGIVAILYSMESSRKILIIYLTDIATYKIASTRLSKISGDYTLKTPEK